jgi:hypothetical protein
MGSLANSTSPAEVARAKSNQQNSFLHFSRPRLKFIFQTATISCPPLIVKGGGHGGTRIFAPSVAMISSDLVEAYRALVFGPQSSCFIIHPFHA